MSTLPSRTPLLAMAMAMAMALALSLATAVGTAEAQPAPGSPEPKPPAEPTGEAAKDKPGAEAAPVAEKRAKKARPVRKRRPKRRRKRPSATTAPAKNGAAAATGSDGWRPVPSTDPGLDPLLDQRGGAAPAAPTPVGAPAAAASAEVPPGPAATAATGAAAASPGANGSVPAAAPSGPGANGSVPGAAPNAPGAIGSLPAAAPIEAGANGSLSPPSDPAGGLIVPPDQGAGPAPAGPDPGAVPAAVASPGSGQAAQPGYPGGAAPTSGYPLVGVAYPGIGPDGTALHSQAPEPDEQAGFVAWLDVGPTLTRLSGKSGTESIEVQGFGGGFQLALGWIVRPGLGVFVNGVGATALNPQIKRHGITAKTKQTLASLQGVGPGVAYSLEHLGLTLKGSVLLCRHAEIAWSGQTRTTNSALGVGGDLGVARTFRLSPTWAIGVALHGLYARVEDDGATWNDLGLRVGLAVRFD